MGVSVVLEIYNFTANKATREDAEGARTLSNDFSTLWTNSA